MSNENTSTTNSSSTETKKGWSLTTKIAIGAAVATAAGVVAWKVPASRAVIEGLLERCKRSAE